jgi:alcohol dehydrogenase
MYPSGDILDKIKGYIEDGKIKAVIDKVFDIEEYADAFKYIESGRAVGKVIINVFDPNKKE